jgi:hypothetical protein
MIKRDALLRWRMLRSWQSDNDVLVAPQPFPSWSLNPQFDWEPPTARPDDGAPYYWDKSTFSWALVDISTM